MLARGVCKFFEDSCERWWPCTSLVLHYVQSDAIAMSRELLRCFRRAYVCDAGRRHCSVPAAAHDAHLQGIFVLLLGGCQSDSHPHSPCRKTHVQMFRAVRVVRIVKRIEPMRVIVAAFFRALPSMFWMILVR